VLKGEVGSGVRECVEYICLSELGYYDYQSERQNKCSRT